jgi:hypothetical protein
MLSVERRGNEEKVEKLMKLIKVIRTEKKVAELIKLGDWGI